MDSLTLSTARYRLLSSCTISYDPALVSFRLLEILSTEKTSKLCNVVVSDTPVLKD